MQGQSAKTTGWALLCGSFLMFVTMLLHPGAGGGLTSGHTFAIISHSLAIFSIPFSLIGFYGLMKILDGEEFLARIGFSIMTVGLFAAVMAATLNGLAMPMFAMELSGELPAAAKMIARYNHALNHGFDYILIAAMFASTLLWSIAILRLGALPKWLGFLGIGLFVAGLLAVISGFYFLDVGGFRIFVYGWAVWIIGVGVSVVREKKDQSSLSNPQD